MIAIDRDDRRVLALLARAAARGLRTTIPATALAQVMRNSSRQARLSRLIRQATTDLVPLNGPDATLTGRLLAATKTHDIGDAHGVVCARRSGQAILTSDAGDLRRLDSTLHLLPV